MSATTRRGNFKLPYGNRLQWLCNQLQCVMLCENKLW